MTTKPNRDEKKPSVGAEVVRGLTELRDALAKGEHLPDRFTMRTVELDLKPHDWSAEQVRRLREETFHASQSVFAKLLAVEVRTVQSWEQGAQAVPPMACRLLDLMQSNPEHWRRLLIEGAHQKAVSCG